MQWRAYICKCSLSAQILYGATVKAVKLCASKAPRCEETDFFLLISHEATPFPRCLSELSRDQIEHSAPHFF